MQGQQDFGQSLEGAGDGAGQPLLPGTHGSAAARVLGDSRAFADARSLGKYQLIASLGRGGMAEVVLALVSAASSNKLTVLKILREDLQSGSADAVQLFIAEARLAARFSHPNVVRSYEAAEIDGRFLLAMEYLEGQAYRHVQRRAAKTCGLLLHEHLHILSQLARGLHYVHTLTDLDGVPLSMVHRDVSPQNVFVTYDGEVKLLDFGIAQTRDSELSAQSRVIKGKLDYMAPEQLKRESVDARADVFALGAMLWEGISGARFAGGRAVSDFAKAHARVHGGETNVRAVQPDVPKPLAELVDHALALDPAQRLPDAKTFGDAIDSYLAAVGAAPLGQSLPTLMISLFERERTKLRALIERQLQRSRSAQLEADENSGERGCFRVAEVETSGWTAVRDLSGGSGLHPTSRQRESADEARATTYFGEHAPAGTAADASAGTAEDAPAGTDIDEPTHPRARVFAAVSKSPAPVSKRSKVGPVLLVALGALSGGVLAWFGPVAGSDSRAGRPETAVLSDVRSRAEGRAGYAARLAAVRSSAAGVGAAQADALVAEPAGALVAEPVGAVIAEPVAAVVAEPVGALVAEPVGGLVAEPVGALVAEPGRAPLGFPVVEPITAPLAEPAVVDSPSGSGEPADRELLLAASVAEGQRAQAAHPHANAQLAVPTQWKAAKRAPAAPLARAAVARRDPRSSGASAEAAILPGVLRPIVERNPYLR